MNEDKKPLSLEADEMRKLGYQVIDQIVDHITNLKDKKVLNTLPHAEMSKLIPSDIPKEGEDPEKLLQHLKQDVFSNILHSDHPRTFAFIPAASNYISVLADTLAVGHNIFSGHWMSAASAAQVETVTINWLRQWCGFPEQAGGLFVSGGSMANLMAVVTAKKIKVDNRKNGLVYFSQQTHSSVRKALRILGFDSNQMRAIPVDDQFRMKTEELVFYIQKDQTDGLEPFCIIGNAGTTNTGAVDPLPALADIARRFDLWFHVDGAYGAAAVLSEKGQKLLTGMERADSITLDPHKWWFQPYEMGCLLVREKSHLKETFHVSAEYLVNPDERIEKEINYYDYGIQLTRSFRALKLYTSLKVFGLNNFKKAVERGIEAAEYLEQLLRQKEGWKIITPAQLGILNVVFQPGKMEDQVAGALAKTLSTKISEDGFAFILTTQLKGQTVLRMCPIHPGLTKEEIQIIIDKLDKLARDFTRAKQ
jgi:aromatic-L-amino-acid decarboxylase